MNKTKLKIQGDRIYLREVELSDVNQTYVDWLNDREVNQFLETRFEVQTIDSVHKFVEKMIAKDDVFFLAICLKKNDRHVGNIKLGPINPIHKYAIVSLFIGDKSQWGKGLATLAINILSDYAFSELTIHKLNAGCYANNIASIKAFEKVGFLNEGTSKNQYLYDGEYVDSINLTLINNEV